jgi:hypothetical protein
MDQEAVKTVRIVVDSSGARSGGAEVESALKSIDDRIAGLQDSIGSAFNSIKNFALGFVSIEAVKAQIDSLRDAFESLASKASTLGVTTEWLQAFQYAAASSSVKLDAAETALSRFARTVGEAALGNKAAVDTMNDLGIKIYDAGHNVRPLNDLFVEAAQKISGMSAGAKANALAIQSMGKEAQAAIPMLAAVAQGSDAMIQAGQKAGSIVSREAVQIWEDLAAASDKAMLKWRAFAGENFAETVKKGFELITNAIGVALQGLSQFAGVLQNLWGAAGQFARDQTVKDIQTDILPGLYKGLQSEQTKLASAGRYLDSQTLSVQQHPTGAGQNLLTQRQAEFAAAQQRVKYYQDQIAFQNNRLINVMVNQPDQPPAVTGQEFGAAPPGTPGATTGAYAATVLDRGVADRANKRIEQLKSEAAAQQDMAAAALQGAAAVRQEEDSLKAVQQALEVYGTQAKATDPDVQALAKTYKYLNDQITQGKQLTQFRLQTDDLEQQNSVLQRRLELIDAAPEVAARELAVLQVQNEVRKTGVTLQQSDIDARTAAVEKQELLNQKMQDTQRQQELWMQPWKNFVTGVQTDFTNLFETIFNGGVTTWKSLTDAMRTIFVKLMAEIAALAIVRPVLSPIVEGLTGAGLLTPAAARQMGFGSAGFGPPGLTGGGSLGGGGLSLGGFGGGGGTSWLGSVSNWLNTPFTGPYAGIAPADMAGVPMLSGAAGAGLTPLGLIGGIGSLGFGAFNLMQGNTFGGAAGILGGGLSLAASAGLIGSAFGPIGMGIGLLGGLLGGLFGGGQQIPPQPPLQYGAGNFDPNGAGGYNYFGDSLNGSGNLKSNAQSLGQQALSLFEQAGLSVVPDKLIGGYLASGVNNFWGGSSWYPQKYTQTGLNLPGGGFESLTSNDYNTTDPQEAANKLLSAVFSANVFRGGVTGASDTLKTALTNTDTSTPAALQNVIQMSDAYDKLGKAANPVKDSIDKLAQSFDQLRQFATDAGLSLDPINAELQKQTQRTAQDFIDNMLNPLAVQMRALNDERASALASAQYIKDNVEGVYVDMDKIAAYYLNKQSQLVDQFYNGAVTNIENIIQRLTYGDLSLASPGSSFAGAKSAYLSDLSAAQGGDQTSITNLSGLAEAYANSARIYLGNTPDYQRLIADLRDQLANEQAVLQTGGPGATSAVSNDASNAVLASNADMTAQMAALTKQVSDLIAQNAQLTAQMQRVALAASR